MPAGDRRPACAGESEHRQRDAILHALHDISWLDIPAVDLKRSRNLPAPTGGTY
jgi:hypothetical protein